MKFKLTLKLLLIVLLTATLSGCGEVVSDSNFTLDQGNSVDGGLFILSQNATLAKDSSVAGSVVMLCCNLIVDGNVDGSVFLLTGNLKISPYADVQGKVSILVGNVSN